MSLLLGIDLGTTKLTCLAVESETGAVLARAVKPNEAEITSPADKARGWSQWDAAAIAHKACACLHETVAQLGPRRSELTAIGITGQQHGLVLIDKHCTPQIPFINWQDRRCDEPFPDSTHSYANEAALRLGDGAPERTGCRLATGFLGATLFWLRTQGQLPSGTTACFLMDYFGALLTEQIPVTDATCAASSGIFDIKANCWDQYSLTALGLLGQRFPDVLPSGEGWGRVTQNAGMKTGLPVGLPVCVGIGDNQASFLGSVAHYEHTLLVNVGTGGQAAAFTKRFCYDSLLETRPFPRGGYLLVSAGLSGGAAYAALERFFRAVGRDLFGINTPSDLYQRMNELAAHVCAGADRVVCEPFFSGTRVHPELRAVFRNISAENYTPAHMTRAVLEGMAETFRTGSARIEKVSQPRRLLVGAGNGLRENPLLAQIIADAIGLPMTMTVNREEAAYGAALLAGVGCGLFADVADAGRLLQYGA